MPSVRLSISRDRGNYKYETHAYTPDHRHMHPWAVLTVREFEGHEWLGDLDIIFHTEEQIQEAIAELFTLRRKLAAKTKADDATATAIYRTAELGEPVG